MRELSKKIEQLKDELSKKEGDNFPKIEKAMADYKKYLRTVESNVDDKPRLKFLNIHNSSCQ